MTRTAASARSRFARHLEHHLDAQVARELAGEDVAPRLPRDAPHGAAALDGGVAPQAVALVGVWNDANAGLTALEPLLASDPQPDPLVEPLLRWGVHLAETVGDPERATQFRAALGRYRARFGRAHALADLQAALTDLALEESAGWQPYSTTEAGAAETDGAVAIRVLRLRDPVTARFDAADARLAEIGRRGDEREFVIELEGDSALLRDLDPAELTLRFVGADRYVEVSTDRGDLFDVEVNESEARLYGRLRNGPLRWSEIESAVVMPS